MKATDGSTRCSGDAEPSSAESLSLSDLLELEGRLEHLVRSGTASLADYGRLALVRGEVARRTVERG